ncbi:calcium-binding protein [Eleftheria terrae]|uniref:calcium-binding protein n=1 Tax=Eleftheria terrae TaxID=1597781 RepID=UPI00263B6F78|nr:calcium-binding protein [Eleftheria terrae]
MATIDGTGANDALVDSSSDPASTINGNWSLGDDRMEGRGGDDTYCVNSTGDQVVESAGQGQDTVLSRVRSYTLGAHVEDLRLDNAPFGPGDRPEALHGTGNALDNTIRGNSNDNTLRGLAGNDWLYGGEGNDRLEGGDGDDHLHGGTDIDTSGQDTLIGGKGNDLLFGGPGDDLLLGGDGTDRLTGYAGRDRMDGGRGDDIYLDADSDDIVNEAAPDGGQDTVKARTSFTLGQNIEHLTLNQAATARDGRGNGLDNRIEGNEFVNRLWGLDGKDTLWGHAGDDVLDGGSGDDTLIGQWGRDTLTGGSGHDRFVLGAAGPDEGDTLTDFSSAEDTLVLPDTLDSRLPGAAGQGIEGLRFNAGGGLSELWLFRGEGRSGQGAGELSGIYVDLASGRLWYNPSTATGGDAWLLGTVSPAAAAGLQATDFVYGI